MGFSVSNILDPFKRSAPPPEPILTQDELAQSALEEITAATAKTQDHAYGGFENIKFLNATNPENPFLRMKRGVDVSFETTNLDAAIKLLKKNNVRVIQETPLPSTPNMRLRN